MEMEDIQQQAPRGATNGQPNLPPVNIQVDADGDGQHGEIPAANALVENDVEDVDITELRISIDRAVVGSGIDQDDTSNQRRRKIKAAVRRIKTT